MSSPENKKINPQVREVEIGIRDLRKIKIYPLSIGDQLKMTDLISKAIVDFFKTEQGKKEIDFVNFVVGLIKENIGKILSFTTYVNGDELIGELTNIQLVEIIDIIYSTNYEDSLKNAISLFERAKTGFQLKRQLPQSVNTIQGTESNTSTKEVLEEEE